MFCQLFVDPFRVIGHVTRIDVTHFAAILELSKTMLDSSMVGPSHQADQGNRMKG
jgi:uncharacterized Fe-S cluster-containing protein